jgi:hypothetical protein
VFKALRCWLEDLGIHPQWCRWGLFSEAYEGTMCPGVDSASKNEYQDTPGSKAGRCVRLTTYHLHVPNVKKIRGLNLPDPHGPVQACSGTALLNFTLKPRSSRKAA